MADLHLGAIVDGVPGCMLAEVLGAQEAQSGPRQRQGNCGGQSGNAIGLVGGTRI